MKGGGLDLGRYSLFIYFSGIVILHIVHRVISARGLRDKHNILYFASLDMILYS